VIRFRDIPDKAFNQKIMPYKKIFPKNLWETLFEYYIASDKKQFLKNLLPSRYLELDSTTIDQDLALLFASWIDRKTPPYTSQRNIKYEFKLLYRSSRDNLNAAIFHKTCNNINKTLVVGKIQNTEQIIGGYNPLDWNGIYKWKSTSKSFIFNANNRNDIDTAKVSYVTTNKGYHHAIWCNRTYLPIFGGGLDVYFHSNGYVYSDPCTYADIGIEDGIAFEELEVFQVADKKLK
jgi:hypothetical protein